MAFIVDLATCVQSMLQWADRLDIPTPLTLEFIDLAGRGASQRLRVPAMETKKTISIVNGTLTIPKDFLQMRALLGPNRDYIHALQYVSWDKFVDLTNDKDNNIAQEPRYFTRQGNQWYIYPVPAEGENFNVHFYQNIPSLTLDAPTNWLIAMSPQLYLYGGLAQLYSFTMDEERTAYWQDKYDKEVDLVQSMADAAEYSGTRMAVQNLET